MECNVCGEKIDPDSMELVEMYNANDPDSESVVVHIECGIAAGLEVA
jgi:hypothetical protein